MRKIPCPHTIGRNIQYCDNGQINDIRCPYWQQDGQYVYVEDVLSSSVYIDPRIIKILDKIQSRFEVIGNYRWYCTQWPGIREKKSETILQDIAGKKYTVEEVEQMFAQSSEINEDIDERSLEEPDGYDYS